MSTQRATVAGHDGAEKSSRALGRKMDPAAIGKAIERATTWKLSP